MAVRDEHSIRPGFRPVRQPESRCNRGADQVRASHTASATALRIFLRSPAGAPDEVRSPLRPVVDGQLVTEGEILEDEISAFPREQPGDREPQSEPEPHVCTPPEWRVSEPPAPAIIEFSCPTGFQRGETGLRPGFSPPGVVTQHLPLPRRRSGRSRSQAWNPVLPDEVKLRGDYLRFEKLG
jgi:hypothetical protein